MKVERLLAIVMMLLNKRRMSARELADRFEVSLRTVYRDLETINAAGIPIVAYPGTSGGYEIMENFTIDRQYLSADELVAVIAALKGVHSSTDDKQIGHLLEKIKALLATAPTSLQGGEHPVVYDFNPWGSSPAIEQKVARLREAIESRQRARIVYTKIQGEASERTIEPVRLIIKGYVWYVYAFCRGKEAFRLFRLSRVAELELLPEHFAAYDCEVETLQWQDEWDHGEKIALVLQFSPRVHVRVRDMFDPQTIETAPNGEMTVRTTMADDEWLTGMLLSYGDSVQVLAPDFIRQRIADTAPLWHRYYEQGYPARTPGQKEPGVVYGVYSDYASDEQGAYSLLVGVEVEAGGELSAELTVKTIPAATYAVFTTRVGPMVEIIQEAWARI